MGKYQAKAKLRYYNIFGRAVVFISGTLLPRGTVQRGGWGIARGQRTGRLADERGWRGHFRQLPRLSLVPWRCLGFLKATALEKRLSLFAQQLSDSFLKIKSLKRRFWESSFLTFAASVPSSPAPLSRLCSTWNIYFKTPNMCFHSLKVPPQLHATQFGCLLLHLYVNLQHRELFSRLLQNL